MGKQCEAERRAEAAKKRAAWEARQAENKTKEEEWKARKAAQEEKRLARDRKADEARSKAADRDWDLESNDTDVSTAPTDTSLRIDEAEVERCVMMDKNVRKFNKILREISLLEGRDDLDALQQAKLQRKSDVEMELQAARGLARVR